MKQSSYLTILAWIAVLFWFSGCGRDHESNHSSHGKASSVSIRQVSASVESVTPYHQTTGTIRSKNHASIAPKVSGQITDIFVVPGQPVEKDELLLKISALEIAFKLQSAQASLDKVGRDLKREQGLLSSGASTPEIVSNLKDQLRVVQATVKEASTMLSYTEIRAPFKGVITRKYANEGDLSLPGKPLLEIENLQNLQVEAGIPEAIGVHLKVGMPMKIDVIGSSQSLSGEIIEIAPASDPASRTFPVKISLPENVALRSGLFAKVSVPGKALDTILVPVDAVTNWGQIERAFIIKDHHLHMRIVKTGAKYGEKIEILSGLSGDELLAVKVDMPLMDGQAVQE